MTGPESQIRSQRQDMAAWVERDASARLIVTDDLLVSWSNLAAATLLRTIDVFGIKHGILASGDAQLLTRLRHFVRASGQATTSLCVPCGGEDHILCFALDLTDDRRSRATGITLRRASSVTALGARTLATAFHLTPSEGRVVETLFAGHTPDQIGDKLRLSVGTVRVHIKHVYEKLEVRSREAMFHKALPFMWLP